MSRVFSSYGKPCLISQRERKKKDETTEVSHTRANIDIVLAD
jgi:hypothetical protein